MISTYLAGYPSPGADGVEERVVFTITQMKSRRQWARNFKEAGSRVPPPHLLPECRGFSDPFGLWLSLHFNPQLYKKVQTKFYLISNLKPVINFWFVVVCIWLSFVWMFCTFFDVLNPKRRTIKSTMCK
jgi:hypothetical protein